MAMNTKIEWTNVTWNPVYGCAMVSEGCRNCYAARQAHRFAGKGMPYEGLTRITPHGPEWTGKVKLVDHALLRPLRWRKSRRVFVSGMSDLFHPEVPLDLLDRVFAVMSLASHHTFMIMTKRPERMREYITLRAAKKFSHFEHVVWPLPNVWLGVSVEDQHVADERIPLLLQTPAAVRFVSCEPLLGPVDLEAVLGGAEESRHVLNGWHGIDWVIAGGESGPRARPTHPDWVRSILSQCQTAGVPFFFQQWGEWSEACHPDDPIWNGNPPKLLPAHGTYFIRLGRKASGRLFDGREWNEMPI